jgi:hypothetical protein
VQFEIVIDGGQLLEDINKVGVANMMARMMTQGTARKTPLELEEAIQQLARRSMFSPEPRTFASSATRWREITTRRSRWSKKSCSNRAGTPKNSIC